MQFVYGQTDPIPFCLVDSNGDGVTGHSLIAADVKLSSWDDSTSTYNTTANIGLECSEGDNGFYYWTPSSAAQTQHSLLFLYINDSASSSTFVENRVICYTGGDAAGTNSRLRG